MIKFAWHESCPPLDLPVRQVHGWLMETSGRTLIQDRPHEGRYFLAGGQCERTDVDWAATLVRESLEESQVRLDPERIVYLGHQVVTGDPHALQPYAQVRLLGVIGEIRPAAPDPDNGHTYRRLLTTVHRAAELLDWGTPGTLQAHAAARAARTLRLPIDSPARDCYV